MLRNRILGIIAGVVLILGVSVATPSQSEAAMVSGCYLTVEKPTSDGTTAFGVTTAYCTEGNFWIDKTRARVQEMVGVLPVSGTWYTYNPTNPATSATVTALYNCNGHGTDNYRTAGEGTDIYGGTTSLHSAQTSVTC